MPALARGGVLYIGLLGVASAYLLWNLGVQRLGGTGAAAYQNVVPVIGVATTALTLHERVIPMHMAGGAAILLGIGLTRKHILNLISGAFT